MAQSTKIEFAAGLSAENQGRKFTPQQIADHLNVDAKTFRAWMRKQTSERAGSGNRWTISEFAAQKLVAKFENRKSGTTFTFKDEDSE